MTTLIFVRHGESDGNRMGVFSGSSDVLLTEQGLRQAELAAEWLDRYPNIEAIYSSSLTRSMQTARPLAERRGLTVQPEDGLREINGGVWEMEPFASLSERFPKDFAEWSERMHLCRCPGGESVAEVQGRILQTVLRICAEHPNGTVGVFTHATPIRTQKCVWFGWDLSKIMTYSWVPNASVSVVTYENGSWNLLVDGCDEYLAGMHTELPSNI